MNAKICETTGLLSLVVRDDGHGINFDRLRNAAAIKGLPHATQEDLINALFADVVNKIELIPAYKAAFAKVFSDGVTLENIGKAIATYERTIVSAAAPFDKWIAGDEKAISVAAKNGFELFNGKANCAACHSGWRFAPLV